MTHEDVRDWGKEWGIGALNGILPPLLPKGFVIAIEGPRGTFKTNLAMTFLAAGLLQGESGMLIRLHDQPLLQELSGRSWPSLSEELGKSEKPEKKFEWSDWELLKDKKKDKEKGTERGAEATKWQNLCPSQKANIRVWEKETQRLFEVDFKGGALLPEEFVQVIWDILIRQPEEHLIRRVVLYDVSEIGAAYPLLRKSSTSSDIFLPAFAHLMRNQEIECVVTGTTTGLKDGDEAVGKICAVADAVISCKYCDVFGRRYVALYGIGQGREENREDEDLAPPVIIPVQESDETKTRRFNVDAERLQGLVGFGTGNIHRPGVALYLFEQNEALHGAYNAEIQKMLSASFASIAEGHARQADTIGDVEQDQADGDREIGLMQGGSFERRTGVGSKISVVPFGSPQSDAIHSSFGMILAQKPIEQTVICTVDEFWEKSNDFVELGELPDSGELICSRPTGRSSALWPYYANVLLLAYRTDLVPKDAALGSWVDIRNIATCLETSTDVKHAFWYDRHAAETLSCAFLDAALGQKGPKQPSISDVLKAIDEKENGAQVNALAELTSPLGALREVPQIQSHRYEVLNPDSAIYLCWYSQLRELIARRPDLSDKLKVVGLPGGGFTGDWYIGVAKGSVSPSIGRVVLKKLCSRAEGYRRFLCGVGLPVRKPKTADPESVAAWYPRSDTTLANILEIYGNAKSRAKLYEIGGVRTAILYAAQQLKYENAKDCVQDIIDELKEVSASLEAAEKEEKERKKGVQPE